MCHRTRPSQLQLLFSVRQCIVIGAMHCLWTESFFAAAFVTGLLRGETICVFEENRDRRLQVFCRPDGDRF